VPWFWPFEFAASAAEDELSLFKRGLATLAEAGKLDYGLTSRFATANKITLDLHTLRLRDFSVDARAGEAPTIIDAPFAGHTAVIADFSENQSLVRTLLGAGIGDEAALHLRQPELGFVSGNQHIERQGDFEAAANGNTVERTYDRLGVIPEFGDAREPARLIHHSVVGLARIGLLCDLLQIPAGGEYLAGSAGQDRDAQLCIVLERAEYFMDLTSDLGVDGVCWRPGQGNLEHMPELSAGLGVGDSLLEHRRRNSKRHGRISAAFQVECCHQFPELPGGNDQVSPGDAALLEG
jgi:hypothetical protein